MPDPKEAVIQELVSHLEGIQKEAAETKRTINSLLRRMDRPPMFSDEDVGDGAVTGLRISPDRFFGKALATAVRDYLEMRGEAASPADILDALQRGGFNIAWKKGDEIRALTISLSKNTKMFIKLPSGTFGLRSKYDIPETRNGKPDSSKGEAEQEGAEDSTEDTE